MHCGAEDGVASMVEWELGFQHGLLAPILVDQEAGPGLLWKPARPGVLKSPCPFQTVVPAGEVSQHMSLWGILP